MVLTPTYYVFRLYVPFQDSVTLPVKYDAGSYTVGGFELPRIDVIAAKTQDGRIVVAVTNVDARQPATVEVDLGKVSARSASGETLAALKVDAVNTFDSPKTVVPKAITVPVKAGRMTLTVAPASVTVLTTVSQRQ
jgi:alpha-L-arabinofuranosidase